MEALDQKLTLLVSTIVESKLAEDTTIDPRKNYPTKYEQMSPDLFPIPLRIEKELGKGAFGTVYLATELNLLRLVAVKVFHSGQPEDLDFNRHEGRMIANLNHPSIISPYFSGLTKYNRWFIVSEYINGANLAQLIPIHNLSYQEVARLLEEISSALAYAHETGVIHRDIKPSNILIDQKAGPHIADFGLAINANDIGPNDFAGTPMYLSPEQWNGGSASFRTDVWSMGVMFYELLTRHLPFKGSSLKEIKEEVNKRDFLPPRYVREDIPIELEQVCTRCLSQEEERFPSAEELNAALRSYLQSAA